MPWPSFWKDQVILCKDRMTGFQGVDEADTPGSIRRHALPHTSRRGHHGVSLVLNSLVVVAVGVCLDELGQDQVELLRRRGAGNLVQLAVGHHGQPVPPLSHLQD